MFSQTTLSMRRLVRGQRSYPIHFLITLTLLIISPLSFSQQLVFTINLSNHAFSPDEIIIPANTKVQLIIQNNDDEPEEFDSFDLNREKVIFPNRKVRLFIGPLLPGEYEYFGEFHPDTARGRVIVLGPEVDIEQKITSGDSRVN